MALLSIGVIGLLCNRSNGAKPITRRDAFDSLKSCICSIAEDEECMCDHGDKADNDFAKSSTKCWRAINELSRLFD